MVLEEDISTHKELSGVPVVNERTRRNNSPYIVIQEDPRKETLYKKIYSTVKLAPNDLIIELSSMAAARSGEEKRGGIDVPRSAVP